VRLPHLGLRRTQSGYARCMFAAITMFELLIALIVILVILAIIAVARRGPHV